MENLHNKIVKTFVIRLIMYILAAILTVCAIGLLVWSSYYFNLSPTVVNTVFFGIFAVSFAVWWLWHDTKREIMREHKDNQIPHKK